MWDFFCTFAHYFGKLGAYETIFSIFSGCIDEQRKRMGSTGYAGTDRQDASGWQYGFLTISG